MLQSYKILSPLSMNKAKVKSDITNVTLNFSFIHRNKATVAILKLMAGNIMASFQ